MNENAKPHVKIVINGVEYTHIGKTITYQQVVDYVAKPEDRQVDHTVTYEDGPKENPEGTLEQGQSISVKPHISFDADKTIRS
jgi:hypothetical protein